MKKKLEGKWDETGRMDNVVAYRLSDALFQDLISGKTPAKEQVEAALALWLTLRDGYKAGGTLAFIGKDGKTELLNIAELEAER